MRILRKEVLLEHGFETPRSSAHGRASLQVPRMPSQLYAEVPNAEALEESPPGQGA